MLLHKTLAEMLEVSPLEVMIWGEYLHLKQDKEKQERIVQEEMARCKAAVRGKP